MSHYRAMHRRRGSIRRGAIIIMTVGLGAAGALLVTETIRHPEQTGGQIATAPSLPIVEQTPGQPSVQTTSSPTPSPSVPQPRSDTLRLKLLRTIEGRIAPKSVAASGTGLVFAQNMMYEHTVTVYGANGKLLATIQDAVNPSKFGFPRYDTYVRGSPVEAAFTPDASKVYVSNYSMYGSGFPSPGHDSCSPADHHDRSFVYRIDVAEWKIDQLIQVGSVPKVLAVTPDDRYLLASNWCSFDLSVVDIAEGKQIAAIPLGPHPRGIAVDGRSRFAYVAIMGSTQIARVDLRTLKVSWIDGVGVGPRALVLSPDGRYLYATLNDENAVAKLDLETGTLVGRASVGVEPRSMTINPDGRALYLVNYRSNTAMVVRTSDMHVLQTVPTGTEPIGITYEPTEHRVWVSNYTGSIMIFAAARQ